MGFRVLGSYLNYPQLENQMVFYHQIINHSEICSMLSCSLPFSTAILPLASETDRAFSLEVLPFLINTVEHKATTS